MRGVYSALGSPMPSLPVIGCGSVISNTRFVGNEPRPGPGYRSVIPRQRCEALNSLACCRYLRGQTENWRMAEEFEPLTVRSARFSGPLADHSAEPSNAGPPRTGVEPAHYPRSKSEVFRRPRYCTSSGAAAFRLVYGLDAIEEISPESARLRDLNVIVVLQVEQSRGCAECLGEPKRSIGGNAGLFAGDPFDPCARQATGLGKERSPHFQRNQELLPQNLTRIVWA